MAIPIPRHVLARSLMEARALELARSTSPGSLLLPTLADVLPDGLPRGAVIELSSQLGLAQGSTLALTACVASQRESCLRGGDSAWCAWIDPEGTLFAPALEVSGICLDRLLVIRPPRPKLARIAVRVAAARVFSVIIVDVSGIPGAARSASLTPWPNVVRRLALAVEGSQTSVLLLTNAGSHRALSLPVAMRLELLQPDPQSLSIRIAKDRQGRVSAPRCIAWTRPLSLSMLRSG